MNNFKEIFKLCRLCQSKDGVNSILQDNLIHKIVECTKIQLKVDDLFHSYLPKICDECTKTINTFYTFLQNVLEVNNTLKENVKTFKNKLDQIATKKDNIQNLYTDCVHSFSTGKVHNRILNPNESERRKIHHKKMFEKDCNCINGCTCHSSEKFICSWANCNKICSSAYTFKTHQMRHENRRPFLCAICGKRFITKDSLISHEKIHLNMKSYNCELCNVRFSVKSNLQAHQKKYHEGVKFYCSQCTKAYISKASLERHELVHIGIKEYHCKSCTSSFYTKQELLKHEKYHKDLRQYKCSECFKNFFEKHHLTIHLRIHTGERPYRCTIANCGKSFTESQKLKRHVQAKHPYS